MAVQRQLLLQSCPMPLRVPISSPVSAQHLHLMVSCTALGLRLCACYLQQLTSEAAGGKFKQIPLNGCALCAVQRLLPEAWKCSRDAMTGGK